MKTWTVDDVMTMAVVSVPETAAYRELVDLLIGRHFSAVPVVDGRHRVTGVVSEADLLRKIEYAGDEEPRLFEGRRRRGERAKARAATAAELMSSPPVVAVSGTPVAKAARIMDAEQVKRLPVVDDFGRLVGIVTRSDLLKVHLRPDDDIRADVLAVLGAAFPAATVRAEVERGVVTLRGQVDRLSTATAAARLARRVDGVVEVADAIAYTYDDTAVTVYGIA
ncbi:CBS domain-containing protein [Actinoplanes sp. NPDC024001]|uniref:CBS domain-containing protein n=1 Tax=Actinoplanes sp. NPDC024001 TaxID=3154598 RepID=UPI0034012EFA